MRSRSETAFRWKRPGTAAVGQAALGQFVTPEQLGNLVLMLCSPFGDQVRGAAWAMDGGWTAQ
jgi:NAD(P)-dependent dehydrogenase (short-subunit alcohol dehydrogenase family)